MKRRNLILDGIKNKSMDYIRNSIDTKRPFYTGYYRSSIYIAIICIVIITLSMKGITDEGTVSLNGDMPRHMMNGVYFYDLIRNMPFTHFLEYTFEYYARYPALSLGHHPLLLGVAEVPFYALFGVSVFSARLTIIFFMIIAGLVWFLLIKEIYDKEVAFVSSLLFITTPFIVDYSRIVMCEVPTLALIIVTVYLFYKYCKLSKKRYAVAFIASFVLSLFSKQTAVFMVPLFLIYYLLTKDVRRLLTKKVIISCIIITLLILPLILVTLKFSQLNVGWIKETIFSNIGLNRLSDPLKTIWQNHFTFPVLILSLIGICLSIFKRDKRAIVFILWITCFYLMITLLGVQAPRYSIYWIPPFSLFAATVFNVFCFRLWKILFSIILIIIVTYQFTIVSQKELEYAKGYEEAARYVIDNRKGASVLFSSKVDTGYFIFFTRKLAPWKEMVILRADKLLVTSQMRTIIEERIAKREDIYEILQDFGTGYVVIEEKEYRSPPLRWLMEEVKSDKFILRKSIPMRSNNHRLNDVELGIYEYKGYTQPKRGKILRMNIPLMGDSISVKFDDLLHNRLSKEVNTRN